MAAGLFPFWCLLGDILFSEVPFCVGMGLLSERTKKGLKNCSFMLVLDSMEVEK